LTRKLLLLNLVLAALTALAAWQLRQQWIVAQQRDAAVLAKSVSPAPPPPAGETPAPEPLSAAAYIEIAQQMLFSRDRNPVVEVETAPAPPPKPMPPAPVFRGAMNFGEGPIAILSEKPDAPHREYRIGQPVGEFKLVSVSAREAVLEWEGKQVVSRREELAERREGDQQQRPRPAVERTAAPPAAAVKVQAGPGVEIGKGLRACLPNDSTPPGAVVNGLRKVVTDSPFGAVCRWEPVQ
jgi:hypothetical protein